MKKLLLFTVCALLFGVSNANAQKPAHITFDRLVIDVGEFPETSPVKSAIFNFKNTGEQPLVINQAVASCGCTVPEYSKQPIMPGKSGQIKVTYNGKNKFPGRFKKSVTVRTNGDQEVTRIYISGNMTAAK